MDEHCVRWLLSLRSYIYMLRSYNKDLGYDEVSENFVIERMSFSTILLYCWSEDETQIFFDFPVPQQLPQ